MFPHRSRTLKAKIKLELDSDDDVPPAQHEKLSSDNHAPASLCPSSRTLPTTPSSQTLATTLSPQELASASTMEQDKQQYASAKAFAALKAGHNTRVPRRPVRLTKQIWDSGNVALAHEVPREAIDYYDEFEGMATDPNAREIYSECAVATTLATYGKTAWQFFTKYERRDYIAHKKRSLQLETTDSHAKKELHDRIDDLGDPEQQYSNDRGSVEFAQQPGNPDQALSAEMPGVYRALLDHVIEKTIYAPDAGDTVAQKLHADVQRIVGGTVNVPMKLQIASLARVVFPQRDLGARLRLMTGFMPALDAQLASDGLVDAPTVFPGPQQTGIQ